jgi:hypothetical protein
VLRIEGLTGGRVRRSAVRVLLLLLLQLPSMERGFSALPCPEAASPVLIESLTLMPASQACSSRTRL